MPNSTTQDQSTIPHNEGKFYWNVDYIVYGVRQGYLGKVRIQNLIQTSGLCEADTALLRAFCIQQGYIDDESM